MTEELKPCPFCDCDMAMKESVNYPSPDGHHEPTCPLIDLDIAATEEDWNTRATLSPAHIEDERELFERFYLKQVAGSAHSLRKNDAGHYEDDAAMAAWCGWQARAALSAPLGAEQGAMRDADRKAMDELKAMSFEELLKLSEGKAPPAAGVPEEWQPMETAPTDGTLLRLLVEFEDHPIEDGAGPFATVGTNYRDNTGEDAWQIVGWCWEQDRFIDGVGTPVGWLPMLASAPTPPASEQQRAVVMEELLTRVADWCDQQPKHDWYGRTAGDMVRAFMARQPTPAQENDR